MQVSWPEFKTKTSANNTWQCVGPNNSSYGSLLLDTQTPFAISSRRNPENTSEE